MRKYFLLVVSTFVLTAIAQPKPMHKVNRHELGIGYRIPPLTSRAYNAETGLDLMYKRFLKPNRAIRIVSGFQNQDFGNTTASYMVLADTLVITTTHRSAETIFLGFGVQMQRPFFKRIVLTGAIDTRFHYGWGRYENNLVKVNLNNQESEQSYPELLSRAKAFKWDLYPSMGVKLEFKHINFGIELISRMMNYQSLAPDFSNVMPISLFDFEIGQPASRFSFNYRF